MKSFIINHTNFKTYTVYLDEFTGAVTGLRVRIIAKGGKATDRLLWDRSSGSGMPPSVKDVMTNPSFSENVALAMGWVK